MHSWSPHWLTVYAYGLSSTPTIFSTKNFINIMCLLHLKPLTFMSGRQDVCSPVTPHNSTLYWLSYELGNDNINMHAMIVCWAGHPILFLALLISYVGRPLSYFKHWSTFDQYYFTFNMSGMLIHCTTYWMFDVACHGVKPEINLWSLMLSVM